MATIDHDQFLQNVQTIKTNRYGSEIREAIHENFEYLDENGGGGSGLVWVKCTQAEYDAMPSHNPSTLYIIVEEAEVDNG
jgi:hypothetical protein